MQTLLGKIKSLQNKIEAALKDSDFETLANLSTELQSSVEDLVSNSIYKNKVTEITKMSENFSGIDLITKVSDSESCIRFILNDPKININFVGNQLILQLNQQFIYVTISR